MAICTHCNVPSLPAMAAADDPRAQLAELESEITRVEDLLASLIRRRVPLKRKVNRRHSPMLALPVEICSEIFTTCFPPERVSWGSATPLVLGSVCTAWRNLAWSMPWLWSTVSLSTGTLSHNHVNLLEQWIARSAHLPLSITIRAASKAPMDIVPLMDILASCSHRWRTIDFDVPFFFPQDTPFCNLAPTELPLLTSAAIKADRASTSPLDIFRHAPHLHTVILRGLTPHSVFLPLHQITHLHLSPTTVQESLSVLGSLPNLTHCTLEDIIRSDVLNPVPVLAPSLTNLTIISHAQTPLSELLDTLLIPNASELSFCLTCNTFSPWSFVSLIARSACIVLRLSLNGLRLSDRQLWDCLQVVPSLIALSLANLPRITDDTIRALNPQSQARFTGPNAPCCLLPALQELACEGFVFISLAEVVSTVEARWFGNQDIVAPLRKFSFWNRDDTEVDHKHVSRLAQLAKKGMNVSFATNGVRWI